MINLISQLSSSWFEFISTSTIFSALVFILVFFISKVLSHKYLRLMYMLWLLVLIRFFLPLDFALPYSGMDLISLFNHQYSISENMNHHSNMIIDDVGVIQYDQTDKTRFQFSFPSLIFLFWGITTLILSGYYYMKNSEYLKLVTVANQVNQKELLQIRDKWLKKLKVKKSVQIITYDKNIPPFSCGIFFPKIFIASTLIQNMPIEKLESIIAHEMAHIKRRDFMWIRIESLVQIVLFFNPIVWYVIRKRNQLRELLTDEMVLSQKILHKNNYIKCLLNLSEFNLLGSYALRWAPGMSEKKSQLKQRILFLRGENQMKKIPIQVLIPTFILLGWFVLPMTGYQSVDFTVNAEPIEIKAIDAKLESPLPNHEITSGWGERRDPLDHKMKLHKGVDIRAKRGTDVLAAGTGVVIKAKRDYEQGVSYGKYIDIQHADGMLTRYAQLDKIVVEEGQKVRAGTIIGKVGSTGRSTGPHLHFELRKDGKAVNPEEYINF